MTPFHEPFKPSTFVCQPAAALIITKGGEVEVFSPQCSMPVTTFPTFGGVGRTSSLLDEELILLGNDYNRTREGRYVSIQKPRDGLLAMQYSIQNIPLKGSPHQHTSLVSKNTLAVVGGKFKSKGKLSKFTWTGLSLHWQSGAKYNPDVAASCAVKLGVDVHIIFGGERKINDQRISESQVVKINTTEEIAYEMKGMQHKRAFHGCALLNSSVVLLSGGLNQSKIQPDELYNIISQKTVKVLDWEHSLRRYNHALTRMGDRIFGVGGIDSNNSAPSKIAEFDAATNTWADLSQELHSRDTSEIVVSPFPAASLDCVPQCQCGVGNREGRIFGGTETKVRSTYCKIMFVLHLLIGKRLPLDCCASAGGRHHRWIHQQQV